MAIRNYTATISSTKNKDGLITKTVTVDIVYAIINISKRDIFNSNQVVGDTYNDATFSGSMSGQNVYEKNVNVNVITNIHYRLVDNIDQVKKGENIMIIVDEIYPSLAEKGVNDPVGVATLNGNVMAVESNYLSDRVLIRHEQGHNLGLEFPDNASDPVHSKARFMNAKSATGKNTNVGQLPPGSFKGIFGQFMNLNDGKYNFGSGDSKSKAKDFLNNMEYDNNKAKIK